MRSGRIYLDNPGGTQVHASVIEAVSDYYLHSNANLGGPFETSQASDAVLSGARADLAAMLGCDAGEVVFGANMTTLTFHASRALTRDLGAGDEILVTRVDHDGNVAPWLLAARDRGVSTASRVIRRTASPRVGLRCRTMTLRIVRAASAPLSRSRYPV